MKIVKPNTRSTLLLDYSWMPINVITARACFHHFLRDRVTGLDRNKNQFDFKSWCDGEFIIDEDDVEEAEEVPVILYRDQPCLRSASEVWALPTIVVTSERFFRKYRQREYSFHELCQFYKNTCQICLEKFPRKDLSLEHIVPKFYGGHNMTSNLSISCKKCNSRRGHSVPCLDYNGKEVKGTNLPSNFIFIEEGDMRSEWKDFIWYK
jgi:5-methylcytosine-specific restriction endonuclease McrA